MTASDWDITSMDLSTPVRDDVQMSLQYSALDSRSGIRLYDPVEGVQTVLYTDEPVDPEEPSERQFEFPVDRVLEIETSQLETPFLLVTLIRSPSGDIIDRMEPDETDELTLDVSECYCELAGLALKTYLRIVDAELTIRADDGAAVFEFDEPATVQVGARLAHSQPTRRLETTGEPTDVMAGISRFGNAMKTWSPERTFPTLRGHPPLLRVTDEATAYEGTPPDTGVSLTVPPEYEWIYPTAPVAYWLGATVEPGDPALHVGGTTVPLGAAETSGQHRTARQAFEADLRDLLQGTFLLDCAARTEGLYQVELDARRRVDDYGLPFSFEDIYTASLEERLETYLEAVPSMGEFLAAAGRPDWRLTADVQADRQRASILPFLARDLAVVRCPDEKAPERESYPTSPWSGGDTADAVSESPNGNENEATDGGVTENLIATDGMSRGASAAGLSAELIRLPAAESMLQAWAGDGFAAAAANVSTKSYLRRLESHSAGDSQITIDVVVNDQEMVEEATVSDIYGDRDRLQFDIDIHRQLSPTELADVLESDSDFVHYVGHVDDQGFECPDGSLDAGQLGDVGIDTFLLNACSSYRQGQRLVECGAIAGIVTTEEITSSRGTAIGKELAWLLNHGFPIETATKLIRETMAMGGQYAVVGDSTVTLVQPNVPMTSIKRVSLRENGRFEIGIEGFASRNYDIGSMFTPYIPGCDQYYVTPQDCGSWVVDDAELAEVLDLAVFPILVDRKLFWSDQVTVAEVRDRLTRSS